MQFIEKTYFKIINKVLIIHYENIIKINLKYFIMGESTIRKTIWIVDEFKM